MGSLKIALVQIEQRKPEQSKEEVVQHAADLIQAAPAADIYVLPELAPTGYLGVSFFDDCVIKPLTLARAAFYRN